MILDSRVWKEARNQVSETSFEIRSDSSKHVRKMLPSAAEGVCVCVSRFLEQGEAKPVASGPARCYHTQMAATQTHDLIVSVSEPLSAGRVPAGSQSGRRKTDTGDSGDTSLSV